MIVLKWVYYKSNDELRGWNPSSKKPVVAVISVNDIEIIIDEDGIIQEIIIGQASNKLGIDEIKEFAEIIDGKPIIPKTIDK